MNTSLKYIFSLLLGTALVLSCEETNPAGPDYPAPAPNTRIGKAIVEKTDLIASIYTDECTQVTKGVQMTKLNYLSYDGKPQMAFFYEVDLNESGITLDQILPKNKPMGQGGSQKLTKMVLAVDSPDYYVWGAINTDFFSDTGNMCQGIFHHNGVCYKNTFNALPARGRSFFYMTDDKVAGTAGADAYPSITKSLEGKIKEACGGGPVLVVNGEAINQPDPEFEFTNGAYEVHPRTAIGCSKDGKTVYMMVIDGRRYFYSNGMSLHDLALTMSAIGCDNAINLDGGGSSTFVLRDQSIEDFSDKSRFQVLNYPNDNHGTERGLYQGLVIVTNK